MLTSLPHDLYGRILAGSPDAILICDHTGIVRYWNAAAQRVFGFGALEAVGASLDLIIPERLRARHWAGWEETMRTGLTRYGDGQLLAVPAIAKSGVQISIEFSIQLVTAPDGQIEWVVAIIRDVTGRYGREKAIRAELMALKAKTSVSSPTGRSVGSRIRLSEHLPIGSGSGRATRPRHRPR